MKIIATNFEKDENGRGTTIATVSMGVLDGYVAGNIEGFSDRLLQILPNLQVDKSAMDGLYGKGASIARLVAHISLALQAESGFISNYWQINSTTQPGTYDVAFECEDAHAGDYACRAAYRILRSALYRQRYSVSPDLNLLRSLKSGLERVAA